MYNEKHARASSPAPNQSQTTPASVEITTIGRLTLKITLKIKDIDQRFISEIQ
jgi:hypothetical protein